MKKYGKKFGFTLPEALLVIVILGVIGAICIQSLKTYNAQQQGFDTKADKAMSIIGQAIIMIMLEDSSSDDLMGMYDEEGKFSIADATKGPRVAKVFKKHLNVNDASIDLTKDYFTGKILTYSRSELTVLKDTYSNFFYLQDGTLLGFRMYGSCDATEANAIPPKSRTTAPATNICASVFVDVNGEKKPNKLGSDQIVIPFDARGIKYNND